MLDSASYSTHQAGRRTPIRAWRAWPARCSTTAWPARLRSSTTAAGDANVTASEPRRLGRAIADARKRVPKTTDSGLPRLADALSNLPARAAWLRRTWKGFAPTTVRMEVAVRSRTAVRPGRASLPPARRFIPA
jgi:hypothetical protein